MQKQLFNDDESLERKTQNQSLNTNYKRIGFINKQEEQLKQHVSNRNYVAFFELSNELGHSYSDNDPLQEIYQRGYELKQMGE